MQKKLIEYILTRLKNENGTEEVKSEMALLTQSFLEEIPGGFFIYSAEEPYSLIYANKALIRIFGCKNSEEFKELTGSSFRGIVYQEDWNSTQASINHQIASNGAMDYVEYRIQRKDGSLRWVEDYGHYIHDEKLGDIYYVFISDATEKIESSNAERIRRMEVIEGLSINYEAIIYADLDKDEIISYRESERTQEQITGRHITKYLEFVANYVDVWVHPDDQLLVTKTLNPENLKERLKQDQTFYVNYRCIHTGEVKNIQLRIVNVGKTGCNEIVIGFRNIGLELEQEFKQKQMLMDALREAERSARTRNVFLSNMSHDMRTPLNAVFGYTELARRNVGDEAAVISYLDKIDAAGRQMLDLTDNILRVAYSETDAVLNESKCDLCDVLAEVCAEVQKKAMTRKLKFLQDSSRLVHTEVYADSEKLKNILHQLTDNAIKYTKSGGTVSLVATEGSSLPSGCTQYIFKVADTGIGIGEKTLQHIFDPFERENNTTASGVYGMGLGLTIAKHFTELMGGNICIESEVGKGSTFTVTVVLRRTETEDIDGKSEDEALAEIRQHKILIVEDNEINLDIEREILEELGFSVECAENGKAALDMITERGEGYYGMVLMDIQMPVMNGWQATEAIRKLDSRVNARVPIIALSANAFDSDRRTSLQSGVDAHLSKPLDVKELLKTMSEVVSSRKNEKNDK